MPNGETAYDDFLRVTTSALGAPSTSAVAKRPAAPAATAYDDFLRATTTEASERGLSGELGVLDRPAGGVSDEISITEQIGDRWANFPLLVKGQVDVDALLAGTPATAQQREIARKRAVERGVPFYESVEDAIAAAEVRSAGRERAVPAEEATEPIGEPPDPWQTAEVARALPTDLRQTFQAAERQRIGAPQWWSPDLDDPEYISNMIFEAAVLGKYEDESAQTRIIQHFSATSPKWAAQVGAVEQWREDHALAIKAAKLSARGAGWGKVADAMARAREVGDGELAQSLVMDFRNMYVAQGRVKEPSGVVGWSLRQLQLGAEDVMTSGVMAVEYGIGLVSEDFEAAAGGLRAAQAASRQIAEAEMPVADNEAGLLADVQRGYYDALRMGVPMLASFAIGGAAGGTTRTATGAVKLSTASKGAQIGFWTTMIFPDEYGEMRDAGISKPVAFPGALISASLQGAVEMWGAGRVAMGNIAAMKGGVARGARIWLKEVGKEWSEEVAQGVISAGIRGGLAEITGTEFDWKEEGRSLRAELKRCAYAIPIMMAPAGAMGGIKSLRNRATPPAKRVIAGLEKLGEARTAEDPTSLVAEAHEEFSQLDLAPPPGLEAAEAAIEGGPPGWLQQRLAERAAAEVTPLTADLPYVGELQSIAGGFGKYSNYTIPKALARDADKVLDAIQAGDVEALSPIILKHQLQATKGDVQGGPKEVKSGNLLRRKIHDAAKLWVDRLRFPAPAAAMLPSAPAPEAAAAKQPWEMARAEFESEFWFHGKAPEHPTFGKVDLTGGVTKSFEEASGYAGIARGERGGEVHLIRQRNLARGARQELADWIRQQRELGVRRPQQRWVSGQGFLVAGPIQSELAVPATAQDPHRYLVQQALAEGKPVPPEVLAEYPDLAPTPPTEVVKPRTPAEVRSDAIRGRKQAKALEKEVVAWYETDTGESIEAARERAFEAVPGVEGEPVAVEGFTGEFAGALPGEVTDRLKGMSFGKQMRYRRIIKANVPGGHAEDFAAGLPGGYDEFFERAKLILEPREAGMARGMAEARRWGMDTLQYEMAAKAEAAEQLRSTKEPIADIDAFVTQRMAEMEGRPVPEVRRLPERVAAPEVSEAVRRKLRQQIMAVVKTKGLSEVQRKEITKNTVGVRRLTSARLTADDLRSVLVAMEKARPRRVGMKHVVTPKTERKIQTLKARLISRGELMEERFAEQLSESGIKSPTYVDARTFPTETEAKELIRKMNEEALVIRPREEARKALAADENAGLRSHAEGIEGIITGRTTKRARLGKLARAFQGKGARYLTSDLQEQTGKPFYDAWSSMNDVHLNVRARVRGYMERIRTSSPEARRIMKNADAAQRVSDYISSKLARGAAPYPEGITAEEIKVAQEIEAVLAEFEPLVRLARFMDYYYQKAEIPNAPKASLTKATDIYEAEGVDALRAYLNTQTWGIITRGYEPREAVTTKISFAPRAILFGKGHIKVRSGDALAQDRTIFQRIDSYMRNMLNKVELEPQARALVRVHDENMDLLANPRQVAKSITLMIEEAKGFRDSGTILDRGIRRLVSQAFRAVFIRPWMSFRNLWQNAAFNEDLAHGDLTNPTNKSLSDADWKYFQERVDQTGPLRKQYLMQEERALPGLKIISKIADSCAHYAYADKGNRGWAFWARVNRIRRAVKGVELTDTKSVKRAMDQGGFAGMELLQQRRALEIWAQEGADAMARYAAAEHVMNVHFAYERAQRSIVEMGTTGRIWGSLLAFPRSWGERIYREGRKVTKAGPYTSRYRAVGRLIQMTIVPFMVGELLRRIAGKKRNPYNPLNILLWTPGGLIIGAIEALGKTMYFTVFALCGDDNALGQLPAVYSRLAKLYLPFYEVAMDVIEASLRGKNLDRKAARKIREAMSDSYKVRDSSYDVKRTWVELFQKAIVGGKAAEEKEKEPALRSPRSRKRW